MINQEKLAKEIERLQDELSKMDPTTEQYAIVQEKFNRLVKLALEIQDAHNKEIDMHDRNLIEEDKLKLQSIEDERRKRQEIRQILWDLVKMGFSTITTVLMIIVTAHVEQNVILGQHKWALVLKNLKI